jgi:hypothetical protein
MTDILKLLGQTWYADDYGVSKEDVCIERNQEAKAAADVIKHLIIQRDEARMQVCILGAVTTKLKQAPKTTLAEAMQIAEKFGWDCFSNEESGK